MSSSSGILQSRESESFLHKILIKQLGIPIYSTPFLRYNTSERTIESFTRRLVQQVVTSSKYPFFVLLNLSVSAWDEKHAEVMVFCPRDNGWDIVLFEPNGILSEKYESWAKLIFTMVRQLTTSLPHATFQELVTQPINIVGGNCDALCLYFMYLNANATSIHDMKESLKTWLSAFKGTTKKETFVNTSAETKRVLQFIRDSLRRGKSLLEK